MSAEPRGDWREGLPAGALALDGAALPARIGVGPALQVARLLHLGALVALAAVGLVARLHPVYWAGWLVIAGLLSWEHRLVRADDLSRVGVAFFNLNGVIGVVYLAAVLAASLLPAV